ncbi:hypothetical protein BDZ91DRAFT_797921 [Kalaharituber pfeilii]|nr:hypothetical protein BDZ91DRAFT_797921 [Kalaharituber pfeilii]
MDHITPHTGYEPMAGTDCSLRGASMGETIPEAVDAFNFDILESPFFKIMLGDEKQVVGNDSMTTFFVQRELLASLSPELRKHIENEMKEGLNGEMVLYDVDKDTMQRFLQWAYLKDYKTLQTQAVSSTLLLHAKLYVFGDRFNIGSLKDPNPDPNLSAAVFSAVRYVMENVPSLTERLVDYLLRYIAQILDSICDLADFEELILAHPHAAVDLFRLARAERSPPNRPSESIPLGVQGNMGTHGLE